MLTWNDDRWNLDGRGVHAGDVMQLRCDKGEWVDVRVESSDRGRRLIAFVRVHGREFASAIETDYDDLRWPQ